MIEAWVMRRQQPLSDPLRLDRRRIYILPTGYGYGYALMLVVMFLWAINYNNSMCFAMTFLLAAVSINAMWRTHANLLNLRVYPGQAEPVFAGQQARFTFRVECLGRETRFGVGLQTRGGAPAYCDIPASGSAPFTLAIPAERRGRLRAGRLRITTCFPLALFRAWSWLEFEQGCLVYPRPAGKQPLPQPVAVAVGLGLGQTGAGSEDYSGLRGYTPGDSPRHIAWKAAARGRGLLVKQFAGQARLELWLDWPSLEAKTVEARLSQLCQWVLKADREGCRYGLRLPGLEVNPGGGDAHRRRCLEALALFSGTSDRMSARD